MPIFIVFVLVAIDQIVKKLCVMYLADPVTLIPHFIELMYLENRGAAFGIMQDVKVFLIILPIIIICGLIVYYIKLGDTKYDKITKYALLLVISGAIGNLIDRVANGYVVDMLHFTFFEFPVFNVADMYVVIGTIILVLVTIFDNEEK